MKNFYFAFLLLLLICMLSSCIKQETTPKSAHTGEYPPYDAPMPKFSTPVTIEELRSAFYRYSVVAIVRALSENDEANWNFIFEKVVSGDKEWIYAFTTFIAPGTDASYATGVTVALAYALPNNPTAVLHLDSNTIGPSLSRICRLPFIEPEYEFIVDYGKRTLAALRLIDDPYLFEARDTCMQRLQKSLKHCERLYREGKWGQ